MQEGKLPGATITSQIKLEGVCLFVFAEEQKTVNLTGHTRLQLV